MRHALAPERPKNFNINDCSTQRNLNEEGRSQSKRIGNFLKIKILELIKFYQANGDAKIQLI